jgi:ATP-dependent Clp protease ATP-binding subunit ClpA
MTEGGIMAGSSVSEQARDALRTARALARDRGNPAPGSADLLLAAILGQWDDEHAGGPALLRACGLTAEQARQLNARLLSAYRDPEATTPVAKPYLIGSLRFVVDQAFRIAIEARAPYTGTEHLVVAVLWEDTQSSAHELRRQGVSYAQAVDVLATLPHSERIVAGEELDPLEAAPTPAVARLHELARQQAEQHPGDGRISTLHYLLALAMLPTAANKLLGELGVGFQTVVERLGEEGARLVEADDWRQEELPLEGWERFDVTPEEREMIRPRVGKVLAGPLWKQGVWYGGSDTWVMIHPGRSGLTPRDILDRILGRAS